MKGDYIDKIFYNYYKRIEIPDKIKNITQNIPRESIYKKKKYIWKISTVCAILLMICTITFGQEIYLYVLDKIAKVHEGIATAVDNEYYLEVGMEYVNFNNTGIKVNYVSMDDYNLFLTFDTKSEINNTIYEATFKDLIITDENNNLIFCDDIDTYEKYCKKNGKEIRSIPKDSITNNGYGIEEIEQSKNNVITLYKLYSSQFPKRKELNIEIHTVQLSTLEENININGTWKIKIKLPEDFYNRQDIIYYVKDENDKLANLNIESVIVTNTQAVIEYNGNIENYENTQGEIEGQINDLLFGVRSFYDKIWIENQNGEKFEIVTTNDGYGTTYSSDGFYNGKLIFSLTKYDLTDRLYLVIEKNKEEYKVILER